jgi:hypothetical protein
MLSHLLIKNYALIEHLELMPDANFNIVTGETGAGKSIMLGAIGLLLGNRADTKTLYNESEKCTLLHIKGVSTIEKYINDQTRSAQSWGLEIIKNLKSRILKCKKMIVLVFKKKHALQPSLEMTDINLKKLRMINSTFAAVFSVSLGIVFDFGLVFTNLARAGLFTEVIESCFGENHTEYFDTFMPHMILFDRTLKN